MKKERNQWLDGLNRGVINMGALQQAPAVKYRKPEYRKIIEKMLIKYPIYKQMQQIDYPPLIPSSDEQVQGGLKKYKSTTEKYGIRRAERAKIIDQVEYALLFLSSDERKLIAETYFTLDREPVYIVQERLGLGKTAYHERKRAIFKKMAEVLMI